MAVVTVPLAWYALSHTGSDGPSSAEPAPAAVVAGEVAFERVDSGPVDVEVVLASPALTDRLCAPLLTEGSLSCGNGSTAVLNSVRRLRGADAYAGDLASCRQYVVNHEVGHTIGHHHERCAGAGRLAPVMMQQTKGVGACLPSPWPYP